MPVEGGDSVLLVKVPEGGDALQVSPDGTQLAFGYQEGRPVPTPKVATVPVAGGPTHVVSQVPIGNARIRLVALWKSSSARVPQKRCIQHLGATPVRRPTPPDHKLHLRPDH